MRGPRNQLTDTQLILLSSASQRDDGLAVLPATLKGGAAQKVVTKLIAAGFLDEVTVTRDQPLWRTSEAGHPVGLKITKAGETAIGIDDDSPSDATTSVTSNGAGGDGGQVELTSVVDPAPRTGSKQALIISLLRRGEGATIDDLIAATGWLPHTTRAALTGLRKKGYILQKTRREDSKTAYAVPSPEPALSESDEGLASKQEAA